MKNKQNYIPSIDTLITWIALLPFAVPLLYIRPFAGITNNQMFHATILIAAGLIGAYLTVHAKLYTRMRLKLLGVLILFMAASTFRSPDMYAAIFGRIGDDQGLLLQLSTLVIAVIASSKVLDWNYWLQATKIMQLACAISLLINIPAVLEGYRLSGLLLHDTAMGIYATITLGLSLLVSIRSNKKSWYQIALAGLISLIVILSASRLAIILTLLIIGTYGVALPAARKQILTFTLVFAGIFIVASLFFPTTERLNSSNKIANGVGYRHTLYKWSVEHAGFPVIGASSYGIKDQLQPEPDEAVPEALEDTFFVGYPLWYSHSQWIDIWIAYGIAGFGIFIWLIAAAGLTLIRRVYRSVAKERYPLLALSTVALAAALHLSINTPSVELWPFVWLVICFGLMRKPIHAK